MTEPAATTKTDRRKQIRILRGLNDERQAEGDRKIHSKIPAVALRGYQAHDEAYAIRWALGYVARHINMETGELTISLNPEEDTL